jgi:hypothetical protein
MAPHSPTPIRTSRHDGVDRHGAAFDRNRLARGFDLQNDPSPISVDPQSIALLQASAKIGRASCRERVS